MAMNPSQRPEIHQSQSLQETAGSYDSLVYDHLHFLMRYLTRAA